VVARFGEAFHDLHRYHPETMSPGRRWRALNEDIEVVAVRGTHSYLVDGNRGIEYRVDTATPSCDCPDWQKREPDGGCKHIIAARLYPDDESGCSGDGWSPSDALGAGPLRADPIGGYDYEADISAADTGSATPDRHAESAESGGEATAITQQSTSRSRGLSIWSAVVGYLCALVFGAVVGETAGWGVGLLVAGVLVLGSTLLAQEIEDSGSVG
jgi:hypothetical protein